MKKSLSLIVSIAMVFSLFASVAFAADKTAMDKFNELKAAGIFTGTGDADDAALAEEMDRGSAAVIVARLAQLDTTTPAEPTFSDVNDSQPWYGYVEAAVKAGIIVGNGDGTYTPYDKVTLQELAVMVAKTYAAATGTEIDLTATADVDADDWAKAYIKAATDLGLFSDVTEWTSNATREALVNVTYEAYAAVAPAPDNIGISKFEATGAKAFTVTLDGPVDKDNAKLALQRNGVGVSDVTVTWSDDAKTATLALNTKINEATYSVTLSGIDNLNADKATASVDTKAEMIKSIEITTASETLPFADGVKVEFVAKNQYGEQSTLSSSSFTFSTGGVAYSTVSGEQALKLNLVTATKVKGDRVPVTIIYSDSNSTAQANKIFTVGEAPIVSKIEVGDLYNSDKEKIDSIEAGKTAYVDVKAYDQYGVRVSDATTLNDSGKGVTVVVPDNDLLKGTSNTTSGLAFVSSVIGDSADDAAFSVKVGSSSKDVTVTFFANGTGQSLSKVIHISTPSVPATVEFGNYTDTIAKNDDPTFIPLVVKDASGKELTAQQIADAASNGKFTTYAVGGQATIPSDGDNYYLGGVSVSSSTTGAIKTVTKDGIQLTGANKGKVVLGTLPNTGNGSVVVMLRDYPAEKATFNVSVSAVRAADHISVSSAAAAKVLFGATSDVKFKTFDQYNGDWKNSSTVTDYVYLKLERVSGTGTGVNISGAATLNLTGSATAKIDAGSLFDTALTWNAPTGSAGTYKLTATLYKQDSDDGVSDPSTGDVELSKATSVIEITDGKSLTLTYSVSIDKATDNTLISVNSLGTPSYTNYNDAATAKPLYAKAIKVSAKDSNDNTVALPSSIDTIDSSNPGVVAVDSSLGKVVGLGDGTASINVLFNTPSGKSAASLDITVKKDRPAVAKIVGDKTTNSVTTSYLSATAKNVWDTSLFKKLKVTDQYGTEYVQDNSTSNISSGTYPIVISYFVSDIKHHGTESDDTITVLPAGTIQIVRNGSADDISSFVLHAMATNGQEATVEITVD